MNHVFPRVFAWVSIACVALLAITGEVLIAAAMRRLGDLDIIRARAGLPGTIYAVMSSPFFLAGVFCMTLNFFAMLFTLSRVDLSLAMPGVASFTYVGNAVAARLFLKEDVNRRRWIAIAFVCVGVFLLAV